MILLATVPVRLLVPGFRQPDNSLVPTSLVRTVTRRVVHGQTGHDCGLDPSVRNAHRALHVSMMKPRTEHVLLLAKPPAPLDLLLCLYNLLNLTGSDLVIPRQP